MRARTTSRGLTRIDVQVTFGVLTVLAILAYLVLAPAIHHVRAMDFRARCATNLSAIGKAMHAYAQDQRDLLPVAGGRGTKWGASLRNWTAANRSETFGLDPNGAGGEATISSSLYLLVRYRYQTAQTFLCKGDRHAKAFTPDAYGLHSQGITEVWDFGPNPAKRCSYSYQMVYGPYKLMLAAEPSLAIAADRNPWINGKSAKDFSHFVPDFESFQGSAEQARCGNAPTHYREGQSVVYLDTHVTFEVRPYCGVLDDNIYTSWDGKDRIRGKPPVLGSQPAGEEDSLLVNDLPAPRG
jgi:hypothetical protein